MTSARLDDRRKHRVSCKPVLPCLPCSNAEETGAHCNVCARAQRSGSVRVGEVTTRSSSGAYRGVGSALAHLITKRGWGMTQPKSWANSSDPAISR